MARAVAWSKVEASCCIYPPFNSFDKLKKRDVVKVHYERIATPRARCRHDPA
jgi:hypothetical protein